MTKVQQNATVATPVANAQPAKTGLVAFNKAIASDRMQTYLHQVLAERKASFVNNIVALVGNSIALQQCDPMTIIYAGMKATALGLPLDPNLGQAYVIPYNNKTGAVAQFQIGYKGFIQLAIRSGLFKTLNVTEIKQGEVQELDLLTGEQSFKALPNRHELPTIGYVAFFRLDNGFEKSLYMTLEEVKAHRAKFSKARNSPWDSDFDAMAKKTVLKLLLNRFAPLSVEMQSAVTADQAVFRENADKAEYVDNPNAEEAKYEEVVEESYTDEEYQDALLAISTIDNIETLKNYWANDIKDVIAKDRAILSAYKDRLDELEGEATEGEGSNELGL